MDTDVFHFHCAAGQKRIDMENIELVRPPLHCLAMRFLKQLSSLPSSILILTLSLVVAGCSDENTPYDPKVLRVAVLPDESPDQLLTRHKPLIEFVAKGLGVEYKLIIPDDYSHFDRLFSEGKVDLAYFGGVTFVLANAKNDAQAVAMRDIDANFTSSFLVLSSNPAPDIESLKGESLAFGSRLSTSGHLMPRYFLNKNGYEPENFFSDVTYSGAHDKTAEWVRDGVVTLGALNSRVVERMYDSGRLSADKVRILWRTPPYPDYVWAVRNNVSETFRSKMQDLFLSLSITNPENRVILERAHAKGFLPAHNKDFELLKKISETLGLLDAES